MRFQEALRARCPHAAFELRRRRQKRLLSRQVVRRSDGLRKRRFGTGASRFGQIGLAKLSSIVTSAGNRFHEVQFLLRVAAGRHERISSARSRRSSVCAQRTDRVVYEQAPGLLHIRNVQVLQGNPFGVFAQGCRLWRAGERQLPCPQYFGLGPIREGSCFHEWAIFARQIPEGAPLIWWNEP